MHWLSYSFRFCHLWKVEVVEYRPYLVWNSSVHHVLPARSLLDGRPCRLLQLRVPDAWWSYCIIRSLPESKIYWHRLFRFRSGECRILRGVGVGTEALCRDASILACVQSVPIVRTLYFRTRIEIRKLWPVWTSFFSILSVQDVEDRAYLTFLDFAVIVCDIVNQIAYVAIYV